MLKEGIPMNRMAQPSSGAEKEGRAPARNRMRKKAYILLHVLLLLYAASTVLSKLAAGEEFLSPRFLLYYGGVLALLAVYALGWQQVIKRLPLTAAYANKAVTVVWGLAAGMLFFGEPLTAGKAAGAVLVIAGVVLFAFSEEGGGEA